MKIANKAVASSHFIGAELARFLPKDRVEVVPPFLRSDRLPLDKGLRVKGMDIHKSSIWEAIRHSEERRTFY